VESRWEIEDELRNFFKDLLIESIMDRKEAIKHICNNILPFVTKE
jgi:hypothetical protein